MPRKATKMKPINRHKLVKAVGKVRVNRMQRLEAMLNTAERMERQRRGMDPVKEPIRLSDAAGPLF